jgi:hypothetical protein
MPADDMQIVCDECNSSNKEIYSCKFVLFETPETDVIFPETLERFSKLDSDVLRSGGSVYTRLYKCVTVREQLTARVGYTVRLRSMPNNT